MSHSRENSYWQQFLPPLQVRIMDKCTSLSPKHVLSVLCYILNCPAPLSAQGKRTNHWTLPHFAQVVIVLPKITSHQTLAPQQAERINRSITYLTLLLLRFPQSYPPPGDRSEGGVIAPPKAPMDYPPLSHH